MNPSDVVSALLSQFAIGFIAGAMLSIVQRFFQFFGRYDV